MSRAHNLPGLLFLSMSCTSYWRAADLGSTQQMTSEESDNAAPQADHVTELALLRLIARIDVKKTKSHCCVAAGTISPARAATKVLIPHERLRQATLADTTLIAPDRQHAQPTKGYKHVGGAHA